MEGRRVNYRAIETLPGPAKCNNIKYLECGLMIFSALSSGSLSCMVNGDSEKTVSKRSRKKKTLAELKDEENCLLKERRELKREIAAVRMNLEKQRAENENLKRKKIELQPLPDREITSVAEESTSDELQPKTTLHPLPPMMPPMVSAAAVTLQSSTSTGCAETNAGAASSTAFVLPDLNIPFEEDACPDLICSVS